MVAQLHGLAHGARLGYWDLHDDALAGAIDIEATNLNAVLVLDRLDVGSLADNLDELLASVAVLVDVANLTRGHFLGQGNVDGELNTTEPRSARICEYIVTKKFVKRLTHGG